MSQSLGHSYVAPLALRLSERDEGVTGKWGILVAEVTTNAHAQKAKINKDKSKNSYRVTSENCHSTLNLCR
jgi:hypothetical protein